jgi:hypothetical protein
MVYSSHQEYIIGLCLWLIRRRCYKGDEQIKLVARRTRAAVYLRDMPCTTQRAMPKQNTVTRNRQLQARRATGGPEAPRLKNRPHRAKRRDTQRYQKTGARGAEIVTGAQRARQGDTPRPCRPARAASGREKQQQRPPSRQGRSRG